MAEDGLSYRDAGVDIEEAQQALSHVTQAIQATYTPRVLGGVGGFGALFSASFPEMSHPLLVTSIDGVGTKTKVAAMAGLYDGLGHDIVNHCINDILCQGATPLLFMDYFGCSKLERPAFEAVVRGAASACQASGVALVGGETAEMPGVYEDGELDVVGAIVGVVDMDRRLPRSKPQNGDAVIGLASDGLHTNGFSLARKALFDVGGMSVRDPMPETGHTVGEELLIPHRCYAPAVLPLLAEYDDIRAVAHITGGGLVDNVPRVLPVGRRAVIDRSTWEPLPIFRLIQQVAGVSDDEMFRTFNMGVGLVLICSRELAPVLVDRLDDAGVFAATIGEIADGMGDVRLV